MTELDQNSDCKIRSTFTVAVPGMHVCGQGSSLHAVKLPEFSHFPLQQLYALAVSVTITGA